MTTASIIRGSPSKGATVSPRPANQPDEASYSGKLAARIRALREAKKLSVEELAAKVTAAGYAVSARTIYAWEDGSRSPTIEALPCIARALGLASAGKLLP